MSKSTRNTSAVIGTLTSMKLAVGLIGSIVVVAMLSTVIPQRAEEAWYLSRYPAYVGRIILSLGFDSVFSSPVFLALATLFVINLTGCTVTRLIRELAGRRRRDFGPDLIHLGLLVLVIGGVMSHIGRREAQISLAAGERVNLEGRFALVLEAFSSEFYPDGRPAGWESTVDLYVGDRLVLDDYTIEVNRPLSYDGIDVIQASYGARSTVTLVRDDGSKGSLTTGDALAVGDHYYRFTGVAGSSQDAGARFEHQIENQTIEELVVSVGDSIAGLTVESVESIPVTGLLAVEDPGFGPVLIGFLMILAGFTLTCIGRFRTRERA